MNLRNNTNSIFFRLLCWIAIVSYIQSNNSLNTSRCNISEKVEYIDIDKVERKCKHFIPKTYVYIYKTYPGGGGKRLIFIKDNHVIQSITAEVIDPFDETPIIDINHMEDYNATKEAVTGISRGTYWTKNIDICLLSERFNFLRNVRNDVPYVKEAIEVNEKYGYLSVIELIKHKKRYNGARLYRFANKFIYSYGLLLLPSDIKYTQQVTKKILDKYTKAFECEAKLKQIKKEKNDTPLTLLEKAVGREKLECLERHLVWE